MTGQATRVVCTRCGANNFPGNPQCFQCGGSLPPPEALPGGSPAAGAGFRVQPSARAPYNGPQPPLAQPFSAAPRRRSPWLFAAPVVAVVLLVLGGWMALRSRAAMPGPPAASAQSDLDALDRLRRTYAAPGAAAPSGQPTASAAEDRELQRLREKYNLDDPSLSSRATTGTGGSAPSVNLNDYRNTERLAPAYEFH